MTLLYPLLSVDKLALVLINNNKAEEPDIGVIGDVEGVKLAVYFATPFTQWKLVILPLYASDAKPDTLFPTLIIFVVVKLVELDAADPNCTPLRYTFKLPAPEPERTTAKWFQVLFKELVIDPKLVAPVPQK
jgi:hypothetical protein